MLITSVIPACRPPLKESDIFAQVAFLLPDTRTLLGGSLSAWVDLKQVIQRSKILSGEDFDAAEQKVLTGRQWDSPFPVRVTSEQVDALKLRRYRF